MSDGSPRNNFSGPSEEVDFEPLNFDIEELDDVEYQIPTVAEPPSLESILSEADDGFSLNGDADSLSRAGLLEPGSETKSLASQRSRSGERRRHLLGTNEAGSETLSVGSQRSVSSDRSRATTAILRHVLLKGISVQLASAAERVDAGNATAVAVGALLALGTSRGLTLIFDARQALQRVLHSPDAEHGSVSCLSFNADCSRLLVGFARGLILMFDLTNGNLLRTLTDVHPPNTAVLSLKFTDLPTLALCADSGGSVFELSFTRTLGVRRCDTRCLFSGSRGEVTTMTPLLLQGLNHPLHGAVITAMATLTKVIVVCIRPKLRVILVRPLAGGPGALPLLSWHLVPIQAGTGKVIDPVLACAKAENICFYQISVDNVGKLSVSALQRLVVGYSLLALHWLNSWTLALLDVSERLHLVDIHTHQVLETADLSNVGLVYESSHFKGIFTGGNVSKAMARAGEKACYSTVVSHGGQLLLLGFKSLHVLTIRPWSDRLIHLVNQGKYAVALALAQSFYDDPKTITSMRGSREKRREAARLHAVRILQQFAADMASPGDDIPTIVQYAITLEAPDILFTRLWDGIYLDTRLKSIFLSSLEQYILNDQLTAIPPAILQQFVLCYEQNEKFQALEACVLHLEIASLDLHLVMQICKAHALYDAIIYLQNQAFCDFTSPLQDLLPVLQKALTSGIELTGKEVELGNKLLVYINCCLAGRGYPSGDIPRDSVQTVKHDVFSCLTCLHSKDGGDSELPYPHLRTLLQFDTREFLNVVSLAFTEPEFTTELGLRQRQRLVDILLQVMVNSPGFTASQVGTLFTFLARQLSRPASGLQIAPAKFHPVFEFLTDSTAAHREERQQTLLELLRAAGLQGYPKQALLERARQAEFFRVCEVIYEQCGEWDQVFRCYLEDARRRPQVFSFLRNIFLLSRSPADVTVLLDAVQAHMQDLLTLDEGMAGALVAAHLIDRLDAILEILPDEQGLTLLRAALYSRPETEGSNHELCVDYFPRYVDLCARLQPEATVAALQKHVQLVDIDVLLDVVRANGHAEAQAFLLERKGEFLAAFQVLNKEILETLEGCWDKAGAQLDRLMKTAVVALQRPGTDQLWTSLLDTVLSKKSLPNPDKTKLLQMVLSGSAGFSNPSSILNFLLRHSAYSGATFGDLRPLFSGMLEDSRYEATLAATTLDLVHGDLHTQLTGALRTARRAVRPSSDRCAVCGDEFLRTAVVVFPCGHPVHERCSATCQCPVCATIALDRTTSRPPKKSDLLEAEPCTLKLQVGARPILDLERFT